ncbi:MAG: hypothetical protein HDKAJFGB_01022 [Anaerolineae bacterium]|nr:hypothetical protein [Anaerolineae bacterium]
MRHTHIFVLKILLDAPSSLQDEGCPARRLAPLLRGQLCEPASADAWRASFANLDELVTRLAARLDYGVLPGMMETAQDSTVSNERGILEAAESRSKDSTEIQRSETK